MDRLEFENLDDKRYGKRGEKARKRREAMEVIEDRELAKDMGITLQELYGHGDLT